MVVNKSGPLPISVTFTANDSTLTSHVWKINGTQESTSSSFTKSFTAYGDYIVTHEGGNTCGSNCQMSTETVSITEVPIPVSIETIIAVVGIGAIALIGMVLYSQQKAVSKSKK